MRVPITITSEIVALTDHLTLLYLKKQQLEKNKIRPINYYELWEKLAVDFDNTRDQLIEALITHNLPIVQEFVLKGKSNEDQLPA